MKSHVRLYIEGGAAGRTADADFRRGWKKFLNELHELAIQHGFHSLEIVRGKGRGSAFKQFKGHKDRFQGDICVLLVDSEGPVADGTSPWQVVANRDGDHWRKPPWAKSNHLYLMVQFVETWLLTDPNALATFFNKGFNPRKLLSSQNLEKRSKADVNESLKKASQNSPNGPYRHGQAHAILEFVKPDGVRKLTHGNRLFETLRQIITGEIPAP